jgi:hypothetical protein
VLSYAKGTKEQQETQCQETNRRHAEKKAKVLKSQMQAALHYRCYVSQSLASTTAELDELMKKAGGNADEIYRNQIRLRKYVYRVKGLPKVPENNTDLLRQSVVDLLLAEVKKPLPKSHAQPAAMQLRERLLARHARGQHIKHLTTLVAAQKTMVVLVSEGKCQANPRTRPEAVREPWKVHAGGRCRCGRGRGRTHNRKHFGAMARVYVR